MAGMTMRERIARAIAKADGMHPEAVSNDEDEVPVWTLYLDTADAVLAAMREPTDWMKAAYSDVCDTPVLHAVLDYQAMIDAAINEGKT